MCFSVSGFSQITEAEYYIDTDNLVVGNQNTLTVTTGNSIDENFSIQTTGLAEGLHTLHIRAKGTNNIWSLYKRAYFHVQAPTTNGTPQNIVAAEYYIDSDVSGVGGSPTAGMFTPGMAINEAFTIPTTGLTEGLHVLHIRVKDADDTWSLYKRAYFYVQAPTTNGIPKNIVAAGLDDKCEIQVVRRARAARRSGLKLSLRGSSGTGIMSFGTSCARRLELRISFHGS